MMYEVKKNIYLSVFIIAISLIHTGALAANSVVISAPNEEPYVGSNLDDNGYVSEVLVKAFAHSDYDANVKFYPLARARATAARGNVNGFAPSYKDVSDQQFVYSDPFPGNSIGLLKRKDLDVSFDDDPNENIMSALDGFKSYRFGLLNGFSFHPEFDQSDAFKKEFVSDHLLNIDKLAGGRIDFVVIDKYTAADLITQQRSHLIGELEFMFPSLITQPFHVAFSKKSDTHERDLQAFNSGLKALRESGELLKVQKKHGLFSYNAKDTGLTRIVIGTVNNNDMAVMQKLSAEYKKLNPDIEIEWRVTGEETLRKRLLGDLAINDGQYDVMTIGSYEAPIWAKRKWLSSVTLDSAYDGDDLIKPVRDALSYEGELYALPFYAESSMTYYNKDLFAGAGLSMPVAPNYEQIKSFAAKIHDPDNEIYGICLRGKGGWGSNMALVSTMVNTYGGRWFDEDWEPQIKTPEWRAALEMYVDLLSNYAHPDTAKYNFNENKNLFSEGKCGIWIDATVAAGMVFDPKQSKVHDKVGFSFAPVAQTPRGSHWLWVWSLAVPTSSKNQKAAMDFMTWATSKKYIQLVADTKGWVAVPPGTRLSTYRSDDYKKAAPFSEFVLKVIENANINKATRDPVPYAGIQVVAIPEFSAFGDYVGVEFQRVLDGKSTIDQALEKSNSFVMRQMRDAGYIK